MSKDNKVIYIGTDMKYDTFYVGYDPATKKCILTHTDDPQTVRPTNTVELQDIMSALGSLLRAGTESPEYIAISTELYDNHPCLTVKVGINGWHPEK